MQKYLAEVFGTFILVFLGTMTIVSALRLDDPIGVMVPFGFGLALLAGLYAFGELSGGHFNPAVSLAMLLDRRINARDMLSYWIAQFIGAIGASAALAALSDTDTVKATVNGSASDSKGFFSEIILTAIFLLVILQVTKSKEFGSTTLIAIPLTLTVIHLAGIPFSGASVNPARSFGPALISGENMDQIWIYLLAPLVGAIVGWMIHTVVVKGDTKLVDNLSAVKDDITGD